MNARLAAAALALFATPACGAHAEFASVATFRASLASPGLRATCPPVFLGATS